MERRAVKLLSAGGLLVALALWMQWTAFSLAPVATVLVVLQLTPALVPMLARIGGALEGDPPLSRLYAGVIAIVIGSLPVIVLS
jgi:drug/metabolite transporter (DMT)-like permease